MAATFTISPSDDGGFQFQYFNKQGKLLMIGAEYDQEFLVEQAIKDVKVGSLMSQQIAKGQVPTGEMFFVIKNQVGDVIAKSVLFKDEMQFDNALHSVKDNACVAEISTI